MYQIKVKIDIMELGILGCKQCKQEMIPTNFKDVFSS